MELDHLFDARRDRQSGSLVAPEYWWYRVRRRLLQTVLEPDVPSGSDILEIGSADGPSVGWLNNLGWRVATDIDPRGIPAGGVCASALQLPFGPASFDIVAAFDVIEHISDEDGVLSEARRVLRPGGRLIVSVPAYQWAWSEMDEAAGHVRRYTKPRLRTSLSNAGFLVERATYMFAGTLPFFVADRLLGTIVRRPVERIETSSMPLWQERLLLGLSRFDMWALRHMNLPAGSSIAASARLNPDLDP